MKVLRYFLVSIIQKILELEIIGNPEPAKFYRKTKTIFQILQLDFSHVRYKCNAIMISLTTPQEC